MRVAEDDQRSDADLLAAVTEKEQAALEALHARHAAWLTLWLSHRSADAGIVDDVVQMTFLAVWQTAHRWRGDGDVGAWIRSIAVHKLLDELHPRSKIRAAIQLVPDVTFDSRNHATISAEEEFLESRDVPYSEIGDALSKLSPELLTVARHCWLDGLTVNETARMVGIPSGTVKTRLMRARNQLREELMRSHDGDRDGPRRGLDDGEGDHAHGGGPSSSTKQSCAPGPDESEDGRGGRRRGPARRIGKQPRGELA